MVFLNQFYCMNQIIQSCPISNIKKSDYLQTIPSFLKLLATFKIFLIQSFQVLLI